MAPAASLPSPTCCASSCCIHESGGCCEVPYPLPLQHDPKPLTKCRKPRVYSLQYKPITLRQRQLHHAVLRCIWSGCREAVPFSRQQLLYCDARGCSCRWTSILLPRWHSSTARRQKHFRSTQRPAQGTCGLQAHMLFLIRSKGRGCANADGRPNALDVFARESLSEEQWQQV